MSAAAGSALEAVLEHVEPGQCLPLLRQALQAEQQQPQRPGEAQSLQVRLQLKTPHVTHPSGKQPP